MRAQLNSQFREEVVKYVRLPSYVVRQLFALGLREKKKGKQLETIVFFVFLFFFLSFSPSLPFCLYIYFLKKGCGGERERQKVKKK